MMRLSFNIKSFCSARHLIFWVSFLSLLSFELSFNGKLKSAFAQVDPICQPPLVGEFLVLVNTPTPESQQTLRNNLPSNVNLNRTVCRYNGQVVTRLAGFNSLNEADRWGQYIIEIVRLPAVIAHGPEVPPPSQNLRLLGSGYAVLVDYFNRPETATQLRDYLGTDVGLVTYSGRPYILALYSQDVNQVNQMLNRLTSQGFWAMRVDAQAVLVLTPKVRY